MSLYPIGREQHSSGLVYCMQTMHGRMKEALGLETATVACSILALYFTFPYC